MLQHMPSGPWRLVEQLRHYLATTSWCEWLELGGSLGRGAGDERSDVDAGAGVHAGTPVRSASEAALAAVLRFAPVAARLTSPFDQGLGEHHEVQYVDGRQLSLVLMPAAARPGLPPGAVAVLDRSGRLSRPCLPSSLTAAPAAWREWAFHAWWDLGDAIKHLERGSLWRALHSLEDARRHGWQLWASELGVDYPAFGPVSVENAGLPAPDWMADTLPDRVDAEAVGRSVVALAAGLDRLTARSADPDVLGVRTVVLERSRILDVCLE